MNKKLLMFTASLLMFVASLSMVFDAKAAEYTVKTESGDLFINLDHFQENALIDIKIKPIFRDKGGHPVFGQAMQMSNFVNTEQYNEMMYIGIVDTICSSQYELCKEFGKLTTILVQITIDDNVHIFLTQYNQ